MAKFHEDLVAALSEISNPPLDGKANYGKYATLPACLETARSTLAQHNLCVVQITLIDPDRLVTRIVHSSGEFLEDGGVPLLCENNNNPQKMGSAITYARRYGLCSLLGICGEEDDDGQRATPQKELPQKKAAKPAPAPAPLTDEDFHSEEDDIDLLDPEGIKEIYCRFFDNIGAATRDTVKDMGIDDAREAKRDLVKFWKDNAGQREELQQRKDKASVEALEFITGQVKLTQSWLKSRIANLEENN